MTCRHVAVVTGDSTGGVSLLTLLFVAVVAVADTGFEPELVPAS